MYEYVIVSFIATEIPRVFERRQWPLHVTIVGTFYSDLLPEQVSDVLRKACANRAPISLWGTQKVMLGFHKNLSATKLELPLELHALHRKLLELLGSDARLKTPDFNGELYTPHVTDQVSGSVEPGENVTISSLSLIEFFNGKGHVLNTVRFS